MPSQEGVPWWHIESTEEKYCWKILIPMPCFKVCPTYKSGPFLGVQCLKMGELLIEFWYKSIIHRKLEYKSWSCFAAFWGLSLPTRLNFSRDTQGEWASLKIVKFLTPEWARLLWINPKWSQKMLERWNFTRIWPGWKGILQVMMSDRYLRFIYIPCRIPGSFSVSAD